jgi:hypothetical protein
MSGVATDMVQVPSTSSVVRRKSPRAIDAIRSPERGRTDVYAGTFSRSSRSGLQLEIVAATLEARSCAFGIFPIRVLMDAATPSQERQLVGLPQ